MLRTRVVLLIMSLSFKALWVTSILAIIPSCRKDKHTDFTDTHTNEHR